MLAKSALLIVTTTLMLTVICSIPLHAQFGQEWSVAQYYTESGILHYDYDRDGTIDLTKAYLNTITVYSGVDSFHVIWSLTADQRDQLLIWNEYPLGVNRRNHCLFFSNTFSDSTMTDLVAYPTLGDQPIWRTPLRSGYQSYLDTANVDDDAANEIVYGLNSWHSAQSNYTSRFYVLNSVNGTTEFTSEVLSGYMLGPYLGDVDSDGVVEIVFNLYNTVDSTSSLNCFSAHPEGIVGETTPPRSLEIGSAFPNPFNSTCIIPFVVSNPLHVRVRMFDVTGRSFGTLLDGEMQAGTHQVRWLGIDNRGVPAPSGFYFAEIQLGSQKTIRPLQLVR